MNIETLSEFIEWTEQLKAGRYLFRGVPNNHYKIEASAYRRLTTNKTNVQLLKVNQDLIEDARGRGYGQKNGQELSDLELLVELQHFRAATCLIDFTSNALVALWFACQQNSEKEETNGKVFAVYRDDVDRLKTVNSKLVKEKIDYFLDPDENNEDLLYELEPKFQNNRILTQQSVFLFSGAEIKADAECVIVKGSKLNILKSLNKISGITEAIIFPDFDGFALLHAHDKPYIELDAQGYLQRGIKAYQEGKLGDAITCYTRIIELNPADISMIAAAYHNRGFIYDDIDRFEEAIADYTKAIELNPNNAYVYYNRGLVYGKEREFEDAIADYTKAIELNPNYTHVYNNRGRAYINKGDYNRAITDFNCVIALNPQNHRARELRDEAQREMERLNKSS